MSKSTLTKLGCLPKTFPEIGRFNEGDSDASTNQLAAGSSVTGSRHDHNPKPVILTPQAIPLRDLLGVRVRIDGAHPLLQSARQWVTATRRVTCPARVH